MFFYVSWLGFWRSRPLKMMVSYRRNAHFHKSACFGKAACFDQKTCEKCFKIHPKIDKKWMQKPMWKNALFFNRFWLDFDLQNGGQILPRSFRILLKSRLGTKMAPKTPPRPFRGAFWSKLGGFLMNFGSIFSSLWGAKHLHVKCKNALQKSIAPYLPWHFRNAF